MKDNHLPAAPDGPKPEMSTMLACAHCREDSVAVSMPAGETMVAPIHALMIAGARYCARCDSILCENCGGPDMSSNSITADCSDAMFRAQREEQERADAEMRESYRSNLEGPQANPGSRTDPAGSVEILVAAARYIRAMGPVAALYAPTPDGLTELFEHAGKAEEMQQRARSLEESNWRWRTGRWTTGQRAKERD